MESIENLDLKRLLGVLLSGIKLIIVATLVCAIIAFTISKTVITPKYKSTVSMYVNNKSYTTTDRTLATDLTVAQELVGTYIAIIKSDMVLEKVVQETGINLSPAAIRSMINASPVDETEIFSVSITGTDPMQTAIIANKIANIAPDIVKNYVDATSVKVIDYAVVGTKVSPVTKTNTLLGAVIGFAVSIAFILFKERLDGRIKNEEDIERLFQIPILGIIPEITTSQGTLSSLDAQKSNKGVKEEAV